MGALAGIAFEVPSESRANPSSTNVPIFWRVPSVFSPRDHAQCRPDRSAQPKQLKVLTRATLLQESIVGERAG
jgi:hypothetical protein